MQQLSRKKIALPTDFTVESLNVLKSILNSDPDTTYDIVFIHGYYLNDNIMNLFYHNKNKIFDNVMYQDFSEALHILKNKFQSQIGSVTRELFTGWNSNAFNNFMDAIKAEEIYIPQDYTFQFRNKNSFDIIRMIKKCKLPVHEVAWEMRTRTHHSDQLADIFYTAPAMVAINSNS